MKFYNLAERVFPAHLREGPEDEVQVNWLCDQALERLSIGTNGEVQRFWDAVDAPEVKAWQARRKLVPVSVQGADGNMTDGWAVPDIEARLAGAPAATVRLRIVNPFDPAIRNRMRLQRLFGFEYRNEMFVPAAKRRWGYYVYPLLEGDRFVGRVEVKADRARGRMSVTGFWPGARVKWRAARLAKLEAELIRFARLAGIGHVTWDVARPV